MKVGIMTRQVFGLLTVVLACGAFAQEPMRPNFVDDIRPIMIDYCADCHHGSRAKNGLKVGSLDELLDGGSSGSALVPGDVDASLMYQLVSRQAEPFMPYEDDPLPDELIETIREWIAMGAPANASSKGLTSAATITLASMSRVHVGSGVMPAKLRLEPYWWSLRETTLTAIATSPSAPLIALGGHEQVSLYNAETLEPVGVLAFPEGEVCTLVFSTGGEILLAGGGHGAASGRVVGWDVTTGDRVLELGSEPDVVLGTDMSTDRKFVALGGPDRAVRMFATETGEQVYAIDKHTDWVTALAISPDGVLLATGDRSGAVFVWEADTGRLFHTLKPHKGRVSDLAWRGDSMVLASASDDGSVRLWEMENGGQIKAWNAHGGVLSMQWAPDGRIITSGRDRHARVWDGGGALQVAFGPMDDIATAAVLTGDGTRAVVGDFTGSVRVVGMDGAVVGRIQANPKPGLLQAAEAAAAQVSPVETRVAAAGKALAQARAAAASSADDAARAAEAVRSAQAQADEATKVLGAATEQVEHAVKAAAPYREALQKHREQVVPAEKQLEQARVSAEKAQADMIEAIDALVDGRAAALGGGVGVGLDVLEKLAQGATARAQLEASREGELAAVFARGQAEVARWSQRVKPLVAAVEAARAAHESARQAANSAQAEATQLARNRDEVVAQTQKASQRVTAAEKELGNAQAALEQVRQAAASARAAWEAKRERILSSGGRVEQE
jgi:cytochrome c/WD40 domain-containing protein